MRYLCHRVTAMLRGRIVGTGPTERIFADPWHAYTQSLLSAAPVANPDIEGGRKRIVLPPEAVVAPEGATPRQVAGALGFGAELKFFVGSAVEL